MQGPLSARSAFFVSLSPPRRNPEPDRLLRGSFRCEFRKAARVPPSFGPLTSVDLFGNSRLRVGAGICVRCRLCSRTGESAFGSPHLAEFSGQLVAFSVLFFLWCTLYFSIKQWQHAAHAREQLARDRKRFVQAACRCCRKADFTRAPSHCRRDCLRQCWPCHPTPLEFGPGVLTTLDPPLRTETSRGRSQRELRRRYLSCSMVSLPSMCAIGWKTSRINPSFLDVVPSSSKIFWPAVETETGSGSLLADRKMQIFIQDIKNGANIFERVIQMKRYPQTIHSIRSDDVSRR